jgi:DNA-binding transcriptional LysR family regulator
LEVRHLLALEAVYREGSFRGAAQALGYVQSAVSQQIAALERVVDVRLVERSRGQRGTAVTVAGRVLVEHTAGIVDRLNAARADIEALKAGVPMALRVGVEQSLSGRLMPALLEATSSGTVEFAELDGRDELSDVLVAGRVDIAIGESPLAVAPLAAQPLFTDSYVLLVHRESELARQSEPPTLAVIAALPLVAILSEPAVDRLKAHARHAGVQLRFRLRTTNAAVGGALVADQSAAAIGPRMALDAARDDLVVISLGASLPPREISMAWHRDRMLPGVLDSFAAMTAAALTSAGVEGVGSLAGERMGRIGGA